VGKGDPDRAAGPKANWAVETKAIVHSESGFAIGAHDIGRLAPASRLTQRA
jgi:hypothetical protein